MSANSVSGPTDRMAENAAGAFALIEWAGAKSGLKEDIRRREITSGGIRLPIAGWGGRRTNRLGSVLRRHLCLEISRRGRAHRAVLLTFVSSVHNPKIMLGMLVKVLRGDSIATRRRLPREGNVTFEDLRRVAADFDVRIVVIEGLTSVRYLLSITVRVVTVIATTRSAGLSWSHDTCCIDEKLNRYPMRAYRNTSVAEAEGVAPLLCTASRSLAPAR